MCALPLCVAVTMIYFGVNLSYPPESGLPIFRSWGEMSLVGVADMCPKISAFGDGRTKGTVCTHAVTGSEVHHRAQPEINIFALIGKTVSLVLVSRHWDSQSCLGLAPILIIDMSQSQTSPFVYLSCLDLYQNIGNLTNLLRSRHVLLLVSRL